MRIAKVESDASSEGKLAQQSSRTPRILSQRKLKANRENAKKSTGPKTVRGKENSRSNAIKHGLFARHWLDFLTLNEDPKEYQKLQSDLWDQYQPSGRAEELEVERIALCWWRMKRSWRYENAVTHIAVRDFARQDIAYQEEYLLKKDREAKEILAHLKAAKNEIEPTGGTLTDDLRQKVFAIDQRFASILSDVEQVAQDELNGFIASGRVPELNPEQHAHMVSLLTLIRAIGMLEELNKSGWCGVLENATARHFVPNRDEGERLLRYETSIDRNLNRAIDRLERLQRRRRGEAVPPPVSVRVS